MSWSFCPSSLQMSLLTQVFYLVHPCQLFIDSPSFSCRSQAQQMRAQTEKHQPCHIWWSSANRGWHFCLVRFGLGGRGGAFWMGNEISSPFKWTQGQIPNEKSKAFNTKGNYNTAWGCKVNVTMFHRAPEVKKWSPKPWSDVVVGAPCGDEAHRERANTHSLLQHWHWDTSTAVATGQQGTWLSAQCLLSLLSQSLNSNILLIISEEYSVPLIWKSTGYSKGSRFQKVYTDRHFFPPSGVKMMKR